MSSGSFSFEIDEADMKELNQALEKLFKRFPYTAEQVLKDEAKVVRGLIRDNVDAVTEGHGKKPGTLKRGFSVGKVYHQKGKITVAVTARAPHYHLVEEGHEVYSHGDYTGKESQGKKIVAQVMAKRSDHSEEIAERVLKNILEEVGLD